MTKRAPNVVIRSVYNLGEYCDDTCNREPSMTDPSKDEPITALVSRMLRGELVIGLGSKPIYNTRTGVDNETIFSEQSPASRDGFDLADAARIAAAASEAVKTLEVKRGEPSKDKKEPEPSPAPKTPPEAPGEGSK